MRSDSVSSQDEEFTASTGPAAARTGPATAEAATAAATMGRDRASLAGGDTESRHNHADGDAEADTRPGTASTGRPWFLAGPGRLIGAVLSNPLFCAALVLAAVLRAVVMAGYRPAVLIRLDSYIYLVDATRWIPDPDNTNGYPFFLWLVRPFHSLALIAGLQHLMGLGVAVLMYAILRRFGVPRWATTLAALPTLFDPRQLLIEHSIMADSLAMIFMVAAFAALLVPRSPSWWWPGAAGLLLGLSCLVRPTALPLLVLMALFLLLSRAGWRKAAAALIAGVLPVASYAVWFSLSYGVYSLTNSSGMFLWARTMTFADCAVIKPPPDLLPLCPERNPALPRKLRPDPHSWHTLLQQASPQDFLWSRRDWPWQPRPAGYVPYQVAFTAANNARAQRFALRAIAAQPLDYATVVAEGVALTFLKTDHAWQFRRSLPAPSTLNGTARYELNAIRAYTGGTAGVAPYVGHRIVTRSQQPYSAFIGHYQRLIYLPGVLFAALIAAGLAGIVIRRRRAGAALLLWASAVIVLVLPIAENQFNYRYALAAVPLVAMSAALALATRRAAQPDAATPALAPATDAQSPSF